MPLSMLLVPMTTRTDAASGEGYRTPDIPEGWSFEQASSRFDTGRALWRPARSLVVVNRPQAALDAIAGRGGSSGFDFTSPAELAAMKVAARTDRVAANEYRLAIKERVRGVESAERAEDLAHAWLPLLLALGLESLLPTGIAAAAAIMSDAFTASNGTDLDDRVATGGTWETFGTGNLDIQSNAAGRALDASSWRLALDKLNTPIGDQYAQATPVSAMNAAGPAVRCHQTDGSGYWMTTEDTKTRIFRTSSPSAFGTQLVDTGSGHALGNVAKLVITGDDLEAFANGVSDATATDSTYATGVGGLMGFGTGRHDDWEWGGLSTPAYRSLFAFWMGGAGVAAGVAVARIGAGIRRIPSFGRMVRGG